MAFEVVEQLDWVAPDHFVIPAAGGTLSSRVHKGLNELEIVGLAETGATKINIAQASGCGPIATAILDGGEIEPQTPHTAAHSIAIGAPGDGALVVDAVRTRGGSAATVSDEEIFGGDRPARRDRGHPHRAGRRHHGRRHREARRRREDRRRRDRRRRDQRQRPEDARTTIPRSSGRKWSPATSRRWARSSPSSARAAATALH